MTSVEPNQKQRPDYIAKDSNMIHCIIIVMFVSLWNNKIIKKKHCRQHFMCEHLKMHTKCIPEAIAITKYEK